MILVRGEVVPGVGHFKRRMTEFPDVFRKATGEVLVRGTLNVDVGRKIQVREHFRIRGTEIGEPEQDLLFEVCRINGIWAYRIRPFDLSTGLGGHGDNILEIASSQEIPNATMRNQVEIELLRDDIEAFGN